MHPRLLLTGGLVLFMAACGVDGVLTPDSPAYELGNPAVIYPQVATGEMHSCVLKPDATLECWGSSASGRSTAPAGGFAQLSAGRAHSCAVRSNGSVACWGVNSSGEASAPSGAFAQVSAGSSHSCGVRADGTIACWGFNGNRQALPPAGTFRQVAAGGFHSCAVKADGTLACWGYNGNQQASPPAGSFAQVSAGMYHSCAVRADKALVCWGSNAQGQAKPPAGSFEYVSAGFSTTCALKSDGSLSCWGDDLKGQATPPSGTFTHVSVGATHACALRSDVTVSCWGQNQFGQAAPPALTPPDGTAPVVTPVITGRLGSNGWYTSDIEVSWTVADAESGVKSSSGCGATSISADADELTVTCSATNGAGLSTQVSRTLKRDATHPTVAWAGNAGRYTVDATVAISCRADDPTNPGSGVASHDCRDIAGGAWEFALGSNSRSAAATDSAGSEGSASTAFEVVVNPESLCVLVRRFVSQRGVANAMCQQLEAAAAAALRGSHAQKKEAVSAFAKLVQAQTDKTVAPEHAAVLVRLGEAL